MAIYPTRQGWGVDWRDEFGRRHRRFIGDQKAAAVIDQKIRAQAALTRATSQQPQTGQPTLTVRQAHDYLLAHLPVVNKTKSNIRDRLKPLLQAHGDLPVDQVTPKLLDDLTDKRHQLVAPSTVACEAIEIKRLFRTLQNQWLIPRSPAEHLRTTYQHQARPPATSYPDEQKLLDAAPRIRLKLLLALDAGLCLGEIHALRNNHVNHNQATITVTSTKTRTTRVIPTTKRLAEELRTRTQQLAPDSLLFSYQGKPITGNTASQQIRWPTGITWNMHALRHTFATRVAAVTNNPHVVRVLLGHGPRTSTDIYVHPGPE